VASSTDAAFKSLCDLMDTTPFNKNPYRGILTRVGEAIGYKGGRRSVYQAIKVNRQPSVMIAVAKEIREIEEQMTKALQR